MYLNNNAHVCGCEDPMKHETMKQNCFIAKIELARELAPDSSDPAAAALLRRSISKCKPLKEKLSALKYNKYDKYFTPKQAALIREYLVF